MSQSSSPTPDGRTWPAFRDALDNYSYAELWALGHDLFAASETAPPTDVDELIAELKSALEELRIAGATPKCQRCDYPNCYCKPSPNDIKGSS
jgi:hypothetical protein